MITLCRRTPSGSRTGAGAAPSSFSATTLPIIFPPSFGTLGLPDRRSAAPHRLGPGRAAGRDRACRGARCAAGRLPRVAADHRLQPSARRAGPDRRDERDDGHSWKRRPLSRRSGRRGSRSRGRPFHEAIERSGRATRLAAGRPVMLVSVHSFNPVYRGVARPWHIGIVHDDDVRLAGPLIAALRRQAAADGWRQPALFAGRQGLFHAGEARSFARPCPAR